MCELEILIAVETCLTVGVLVIDFHLTPDQDHCVPAERAHAPLFLVEPVILRPWKSFTMFTVAILQSALTYTPQRAPKCEVAKLCFQLVKPFNQNLNTRHSHSFVFIPHTRTGFPSVQDQGEYADLLAARYLGFA